LNQANCSVKQASCSLKQASCSLNQALQISVLNVMHRLRCVSYVCQCVSIQNVCHY
jgi:hypothetical protein